MNLIINHLYDLLHLLFPNQCLICLNETIENEKICHLCYHELEFTHFEKSKIDNKTTKLFWGRFKINLGFSLLYFEKGNNTQKILHQIKYKNDKRLTLKMGKMLGEIMQNMTELKTVDYLIPVPLHYKKKYERGYNQSLVLCEGILQVSSIKIEDKLIKRVKYKQSQTKLNKFMRWENTKDVYKINNDLHLEPNSHLAIIDDVITTGSTIESIAKIILENNPTVKISVISLAIAK
jgi:competence protein ComFC